MIALKPADIVLVRGGHWVSRAIRWRTRSRGEADSVVNHAGLVVGEGDLHSAPVVEALFSGVKRHSLDAEYRDTGDQIAIFRPLNISNEERLRIAANANMYVGRGYGYGKIALHLIGLASIGSAKRWPICSWLVARAYGDEGYGFGVSAKTATPDDIWDFCVSRPDRYQCVRSLGRV